MCVEGVVVREKRIWTLVLVGALVAFTVGLGLYFGHYFAVFVFGAWCTIESLIWGLTRKKVFTKTKKPTGFYSLATLLRLYGKHDVVSERVIEQQILRLADSSLEEKEYRWLLRLRDLLELKGLIFTSRPSFSSGVNEGFGYSHIPTALSNWEDPGEKEAEEILRKAAESSQHVANLYWRAIDTATSDFGPLTPEAQTLLSHIFGEEFQADRMKEHVRRLTDTMQKEEGVPFLILNLLRRRASRQARELAQSILLDEAGLEHDLRSAVYWIAELSWFVDYASKDVIDYDATIRYLYHLCFTYPDRAAFLEIDSKYFAQFDIISELAREGFLFKESLIERLLSVWRETEPFFNEVFQPLFERLTGRKSKIYDEREAWEIVLRQEKDHFGKEYLYVVEGNVAYAAGNAIDAAKLYERALEENPKLRSALFNLLFVYAKIGDKKRHGGLVKRILAEKSLLPEALSTIGNSYALLGDEASAEQHYRWLSEQEGWDRKADYYRSMFFHDHGRSVEALKYAEAAAKLNPTDTSIRFHLSLCYKAAGRSEEALEAVTRLEATPDWMRFYRFTLERDIGLLDEAAHTLRNIPRDYFDDSDELEQALQFARGQRDLSLLRHLRLGS